MLQSQTGPPLAPGYSLIPDTLINVLGIALLFIIGSVLFLWKSVEKLREQIALLTKMLDRRS